MTPEGKVKESVKKLLEKHDCVSASKVGKVKWGAGWYYMPVQAGIGVKAIPDFIGCYRGRFFGVETKTAGKKPTDLQQMQIDLIMSTGGACFVVAGTEGLELLESWLRV